jgi:hypothetical protein
MSVDYLTVQYAPAADVASLATLLAQRQSPTSSTNGGISSSAPDPAVPDLTGNATSAAYMRAMADAFLCRGGIQAQNEAASSGTASTSSTSFGPVGNTQTFTFVARVAGTYTVHVDIVGFFQSAGTFGINWQVANTTNSAVGNSNSWQWYPEGGTNVRGRFSARTPLVMGPGNNILQLNWKVLSGTGNTANVDTSTWRTFTVTA